MDARTEEGKVTTGNKLIAEFMGWCASPYGNTPSKMYRYEGEKEIGIYIGYLEYHSSWDWLMPVWGHFRFSVWERFGGYPDEFKKYREDYMTGVF